MGRGPVRAGGGGGQGEGEDRPRAPGGGAVLTSGCAPGPGSCPGSAALAGCRGPETPHDELPHHRDPCAVTAWWPVLWHPRQTSRPGHPPLQVIQLLITRLFHKLDTVLTMGLFNGVFSPVLSL